MTKRSRWNLAGSLWAAAIALGASGCVSAEQHRAALADLQRLRVEAWQRSVESASLRLALDRAVADNAALRAQPRTPPPPDPAISALAARVDEVAQRQETIAAELRALPVCVPPPGTGQAAAPPGRKVTDLLYSRF